MIEVDEGEGQPSQYAEVQAIRLAIDAALQRKPQILPDSWMVARAFWDWLTQWKQELAETRGLFG